MKKRCLSIGLTALSILSILMLMLSTMQTRGNASAASPLPKTLTGYIPSAVTSGQARLIGQHLGTDQLTLAIGLPLRNAQALTHLLNEVSTPHNTQYRHYLTQAQANQAFNPTPQQEQQVASWLESHGLTVTHTYPNHLLVDVTGTFAQIEQLFHVTINDYSMQLAGKPITFYAPINEPTVDGSVSNVIESILGLDDYPSFQVDASPSAPVHPAGNGIADNSPPYYPQDFANAYDVNPLWNAGGTGVGQHIGIVLWGPPPSSAALQQFDAQTGATPPNLQVIQVCKSCKKYPTGTAGEAAMDVEYASGMAPGATIDYYEAPDTKQGYATASGLEQALNMAGMDPNNNAQISNSWYYNDGKNLSNCEARNLSDPFTMQTEQILQSNTMTGHDYLFSSGDFGSACVPNLGQPCVGEKDPYPQYPASSAYVTSVGGTRFNGNVNGGYPGEVAWHYTPSTCPDPSNPPVGSGGGYSKLFAQPSWQAGFSKNNHRGYPDVAADADPFTGALVWYDTKNGPTFGQAGGTSLATPLWAGMIADVNQYVQSQGEPPLGFINPLLYIMSSDSPYTAYHDIKKGTNGHYQAGPGWDAVTGLGSPDLYNLAQDAVSFTSFGYLSSVASVSTNDVWAVSDYNYSNNGTYQTLIEHWNGSTWNVVPSPGSDYGNELFSVASVSTNDVWAVGYYYDPNNGIYDPLTEHWDGTSWKVVPSPNPTSIGNTLFSVTAVSTNDVWAVGYSAYDNSNNYTLIEHWDGSSWKVVPSPNPGAAENSLSSVAAVSANDVWAVGDYADNGDYSSTLTEHWDGSTWKVVPSPNPDPSFNYLYGVAAVSTNDVWAVGHSYYNDQTQIEHWDGSTWKVVPSPNPPSPDTYPTLLSVAAVSANNVWAVGSYVEDPSNGSNGTLIEHWNGSSWNIVPSPSPGYSNALSSVAAVSANDVWAVGSYYDSNGEHTLTEHWNGSSWKVVPSPNP